MNALLITLFPFLMIGCTESCSTNDNQHQNHKTCPKNHTDNIIPIVYGYPSEELFDKADSGLVRLGGCEVSEDAPNWFCKTHNISF